MSGLSFRLLGFPVTIAWSMLMILGLLVIQSAGDGSDVGRLIAGIAFGLVILISVLVHELGHALAGRILGLAPRGILLHGFGGLTQYGRAPGPRAGIVAAFAGPFAGFGLGALAYAVLMTGILRPEDTLHRTLEDMVWVNVVWGMFNLLPMLPLDGGHVVLHGMRMATTVPRAIRITRGLSVLVAAGVALVAYQAGWIIAAIFAAFIVVQNLRN
jgi:Zn-dependent protease